LFDQEHDFNAKWTTPTQLEPVINTLSQLIHNSTNPDAAVVLAPVVPFPPMLLELVAIVTSPDRRDQDCSVMWAFIISLLIKVWALMIFCFLLLSFFLIYLFSLPTNLATI